MTQKKVLDRAAAKVRKRNGQSDPKPTHRVRGYEAERREHDRREREAERREYDRRDRACRQRGISWAHLDALVRVATDGVTIQRCTYSSGLVSYVATLKVGNESYVSDKPTMHEAVEEVQREASARAFSRHRLLDLDLAFTDYDDEIPF